MTIRTEKRFIAIVLSLILILPVLSAGASAYGYYSSEEDGNNSQTWAAAGIVLSSEDTEIRSLSGIPPVVTWNIDSEETDIVLSGLTVSGKGIPLTPDGNLTLVDDILQREDCTVEDSRVLNGKQFITVKTKNGNYFYIIIDHSGDGENVYFLNLVDESDLFALLEKDSGSGAPACVCKDLCEYGSVDTDCPVCRYDMSRCRGVKTVKQEETPADRTDTGEKSGQVSGSDSGKGLWIVAVMVLLAGGGLLYWFRFREKDSKKDERGSYGYDGNDEEIPREDEEK